MFGAFADPRRICGKILDVIETEIAAVIYDLCAGRQFSRRQLHADPIRRGHKNNIGRLMRGVEAEPIRAELARVRGESAEETARLHRLEKLRDDLLADEKLLHEIAVRYPAADLQHLRALRRAALKEQQENRPPRSYRAIFQLFKELDA